MDTNTNKRFDILDEKYFDQHFSKSKSLAPEGYKFVINVKKTDTERLEEYSKDKYVKYPNAYNVYGDLLDEYVAFYEKV